MKADIQAILESWPYESGQITVRKIIGSDGREKIQLRLDLGLLQMETTARPDGRRPYGCASVLEYVEHQLTAHRRRYGGDESFVISEDLIRELREEALMNYHRYLALFVLEEFDGVVRDTAANLRIFDLVRDFGLSRGDSAALEQYRPYVVMMHARAHAQKCIAGDDYRMAMAVVNSALGSLRRFFRANGKPALFRRSGEVQMLRELRSEIAAHLPKDPIRALQRELRKAVRTERYEEAARLRDEIESIRAERVSEDANV
jgi:hypothetical protein